MGESPCECKSRHAPQCGIVAPMAEQMIEAHRVGSSNLSYPTIISLSWFRWFKSINSVLFQVVSGISVVVSTSAFQADNRGSNPLFHIRPSFESFQMSLNLCKLSYNGVAVQLERHDGL